MNSITIYNKEIPFYNYYTNIPLNILNKYFIVENSNNIFFLKDKDYKIIVNSINKSIVGKNEQLRLN